jgi:hypothetical protein
VNAFYQQVKGRIVHQDEAETAAVQRLGIRGVRPNGYVIVSVESTEGLHLPGYSGKPLIRKLGVKPGHRLVLRGAPNGFETELRPLPEGVALGGHGAGPPIAFCSSLLPARTWRRPSGQAVPLLPPCWHALGSLAQEGIQS